MSAGLATDKEALRQQMLLRALWQDARPGVLAGWCRDGERFARGLAAYRANAGSLAERALGAAYPVLLQLISEDSFAALARAFWQRHPPLHGDIGTWGEALPAFVADAESLADEPCLADVARLEWAVHRAGFAADDELPPTGLEQLADADPAHLRLRARAGSKVVASPHPIVAIWQAHQPTEGTHDDRFAAVREALAQGRGEAALVWRQGWKVQVAALAPADAAFSAAVQQGLTLAQAFDSAGADFDFSTWLVAALQRGWLAAAEPASP
jgi:Putative DNA-binding domain